MYGVVIMVYHGTHCNMLATTATYAAKPRACCCCICYLLMLCLLLLCQLLCQLL